MSHLFFFWLLHGFIDRTTSERWLETGRERWDDVQQRAQAEPEPRVAAVTAKSLHMGDPLYQLS